MSSDTENLQAIRDLLGEFTTYPEPNWSITDHMFLDFEFWGRLTAILDNPAALSDPEEQ